MTERVLCSRIMRERSNQSFFFASLILGAYTTIIKQGTARLSQLPRRARKPSPTSSAEKVKYEVSQIAKMLPDFPFETEHESLEGLESILKLQRLIMEKESDIERESPQLRELDGVG
ncbi:hypothetical protein Tco_0768374 [Tanacetum coccineum]